MLSLFESVMEYHGDKAQTTRNKIMGIYTTDKGTNHVFIDTREF